MPWRSLLLASAFLAGWLFNGWRLGEQINAMRADHAESLAAAESRARQIESGWNAAIIEVQRDAREKQGAADSDKRAADAKSDRLHRQIDKLARRPAACPAPADGGPSAETVARVFAELLAEADRLAGVFAAEADRNRVAGDACAAAYDSVAQK